jgi:hypothetical protein
MFLVNPLFMISGVVGIIPERRYIKIERSCWNTMVGLIWKQKINISELNEFKELCYTVYIKYMNTKDVDFHFWNEQLARYQGIDNVQVLEAFGHNDTRKEVVIEVQNEAYGFKEEYLADPSSIDPVNFTSEVRHLVKRSDNLKEVDQKILQAFNYEVCYSPFSEAVINTIGFGNFKNIVLRIYKDGSFKFHNSLEYEYFKNNLALLRFIIKQRIACWDTECKQELHYGYLCDVCQTYNMHNHHSKYDRDFYEEHENMVIWFDAKGILNTDFKDLKYELRHFEVYNKSSNEILSLTINSRQDVRQIIFNNKLIAEMDDKRNEDVQYIEYLNTGQGVGFALTICEEEKKLVEYYLDKKYNFELEDIFFSYRKRSIMFRDVINNDTFDNYLNENGSLKEAALTIRNSHKPAFLRNSSKETRLNFGGFGSNLGNRYFGT